MDREVHLGGMWMKYGYVGCTCLLEEVDEG